MFGYISIDKPEMRVKDFHTFEAYYCGLCHYLGEKYGLFPRGLISYDCTFLYIVLAGLSENAPAYSKGRCPVSLFKKKNFAEDDGLSYAAAINVLLGIANLKDKATDSKNPFYGIAAGVLNKAYQKAKKQYPLQAKLIEENLAALQVLQSRNEKNIDLVADIFANLLGQVFKGAGLDEAVMEELGYHLGRYIYLLDAADDIYEDEQKKQYNVFLPENEMLTDAIYADIVKRAEYNLGSSIHAVTLAYDLLPIQKHKEILDNIVYNGLPKRANAILQKDWQEATSKQKQGRRKPDEPI